MVKYSDVKGILDEFEVDERKHLFNIGNYQTVFWARRDGLWRIVTNLTIEEANLVARNLNGTLSEDERKFYVEEAWSDLERPIFNIPKLTYQIIGYIPDIDTINRIWMAIRNLDGESVPISPQMEKVNWNMDMPKGHSIEGILRRLSKTPDMNDVPIEKEKKRKIIRKVEKEVTDEEINDYIWELREGGMTYKQMIQLTSNKFKKNITEHRIRKVIKVHKEENEEAIEEATPADIDRMIISLREQGKTYNEMTAGIHDRYREWISEYRIKKVLRENNLLGR